MFRILFLALLFLMSAVANAQDSLVFYYNENFQKVENEIASPYMAKAIKMDTIWKFSMMEAGSHKIILNGFYDQDFKNLVGKCEYFHTNGQLRSFGFFEKGKETGLWKTWDSVGHLTDSVFYQDGLIGFIYKAFYYPDGKPSRISYEDKNKSYSTTYYEEGGLKEEQVFNGKEGSIKVYYESGKLSSLTEFNKQGRLVKKKFFNEDGKEFSEKDMARKIESKYPEYPGGQGSFQTYLLKNILQTESDDVIRQVNISFMLNEFGRAYEIRVINATNPTMENSIIRLIKQMTAWDMKGQKIWGPVQLTLNLKG